MKNFTFNIFLIIGLMIAVSGCSDAEGGGIKSATNVQTGTLEHPAKLNETLTLVSAGHTYNVMATEVLRGPIINNKITKLNREFVKPPSGIEYLIVFVEEQYVKGNTTSVNMDRGDFTAFSQNTECTPGGINLQLPMDITRLSECEILAGGVNRGVLFYEVPKNSEVVLRFEPNKPNALNPGDPSAVYILLGNQSSSPEMTPDESAWMESFQKYAPLVGNDAKNLAVDSQSGSRSSIWLANDSKTLINDVQEALNENSQYAVSSKYKDAQDEWVQALNDFNSSGNSMLVATTYGLDANQEINKNLNDFKTKIISGAGHLDKAVALFNDETGSSVELN